MSANRDVPRIHARHGTAGGSSRELGRVSPDLGTPQAPEEWVPAAALAGKEETQVRAGARSRPALRARSRGAGEPAREERAHQRSTADRIAGAGWR